MIDQIKSHFFSINDFTSKFIEINDNPSLFYIIDCYRKHYNTQINKIIKITNKINLFILLYHQSLKNLHFIPSYPNPSILTYPFHSILHQRILMIINYANTPL